jgi:hypothetical protein
VLRSAIFCNQRVSLAIAYTISMQVSGLLLPLPVQAYKKTQTSDEAKTKSGKAGKDLLHNKLIVNADHRPYRFSPRTKALQPDLSDRRV